MKNFFQKYLLFFLVASTACSTGNKYHSSSRKKHSNTRNYHASATHHRSATAKSTPHALTKEVSETVPASDNRVMAVISEARSYTGTPYKWGGTTRAGMDCSGLLCTSFQRVNVTLPRTSAAQSEYGKKVRENELQPGDLLFFATGRSHSKVTHVGMVTEVRKGKVTFIHSSSSLGVVENNLDQEYYSKRFIIARRPF